MALLVTRVEYVSGTFHRRRKKIKENVEEMLEIPQYFLQHNLQGQNADSKNSFVIRAFSQYDQDKRKVNAHGAPSVRAYLKQSRKNLVYVQCVD